MLTGYKTYIAAIVAVIGAIGAYLSGEATLMDTIQLVVPAVIGVFLRQGMVNTLRGSGGIR